MKKRITPKIKREPAKHEIIKIKGDFRQAEKIREYQPVIDGTISHLADNYKKTCCRSVAGRKQFKEDVEKRKNEIKHRSKI